MTKEEIQAVLDQNKWMKNELQYLQTYNESLRRTVEHRAVEFSKTTFASFWRQVSAATQRLRERLTVDPPSWKYVWESADSLDEALEDYESYLEDDD